MPCVLTIHFSMCIICHVSYVLQVQLQRERLELSPVFSTAMQHGDHTTGYIRLVNFSQKAAPEMRHAITELQVNNYFVYGLGVAVHMECWQTNTCRA